MTYIETVQTKTSHFKFPAKFRNYRRVLLIMKIKSVNRSQADIQLDDGTTFDRLYVSTLNATWNRSSANDVAFLINSNETLRIQLEIVPYKYNKGVKTELKMLHDNSTTFEANSRIHLTHLTFNEHIDNIALAAFPANGEVDISYVAYGELE